jgi:hypothetical protein
MKRYISIFLLFLLCACNTVSYKKITTPESKQKEIYNYRYVHYKLEDLRRWESSITDPSIKDLITNLNEENLLNLPNVPKWTKDIIQNPKNYTDITNNVYWKETTSLEYVSLFSLYWKNKLCQRELELLTSSVKKDSSNLFSKIQNWKLKNKIKINKEKCENLKQVLIDVFGPTSLENFIGIEEFKINKEIINLPQEFHSSLLLKRADISQNVKQLDMCLSKDGSLHIVLEGFITNKSSYIYDEKRSVHVGGVVITYPINYIDDIKNNECIFEQQQKLQENISIATSEIYNNLKILKRLNVKLMAIETQKISQLYTLKEELEYVKTLEDYLNKWVEIYLLIGGMYN